MLSDGVTATGANVAESAAALKEHTLNRLGHGQNQWNSARYDELGFEAYVDEQLDGSIPADTGVWGTEPKHRFRRVVTFRRQLEASLQVFWFNHFNVNVTDLFMRTTVLAHQRAIDAHMMGRFRDLLLAMARSPAMLDYLDNRFNFKEETVNGREYGPNENYGRELLELHTMGVLGGYVEADVPEVARILTGWTVKDFEFFFNANRHDAGEKTVLGTTYPSGRFEEEGIELLDLLAAHPSTAAFLSTKLCRYFVSEDPSPSIVDVASAAFSGSDGDLPATIRAIVTSSHFTDATSFRSKVKPPMRYLASAVLGMGATEYIDYQRIEVELVDGFHSLGETPYRVGPPTGYPDDSRFWVSGQTMLGRFQLAGLIANTPPLRRKLIAVAGVDGSVIGATVDAIVDLMCPGGVSAETREEAAAFAAKQGSSKDLRVSAAAQAVLCSPEFVRF